MGEQYVSVNDTHVKVLYHIVIRKPSALYAPLSRLGMVG